MSCLDGVDPSDIDFCERCGEPRPYWEMENCQYCGDIFCAGFCIEEHEVECGEERCEECQRIIDKEPDPVCPICDANLCEECYSKHLKRCEFKKARKEGQELLTRWFC